MRSSGLGFEQFFLEQKRSAAGRVKAESRRARLLIFAALLAAVLVRVGRTALFGGRRMYGWLERIVDVIPFP